MSFLDKIRNKSKVSRGRLKRRAGRATGRRGMQAEGLADQVTGGARQLAEWLKDAGKDLRRSVRH